MRYGNPVRISDLERASSFVGLTGARENAVALVELVNTVARMIELEPKISDEDVVPPPVPVNYVSDLTRVREQLGWRPQIGLEDGLRSLL